MHNAITDVPGVTVGHCTLIEGSAVRTGITAIRPRGADMMPTFAGQFALNGNGELTGAAWIAESGLLDGPVLLTNTHSVGAVRDGYVRWLVDNRREPATNANRSGGFWALPVVGETFDGILNDINGFHVTHAHVAECLATCAPGAVREGSVGAGTGTISFGFKAGIGTASRIVRAPRRFSLGVLVQANCGRIEQLTICGVPVGRAFARASANGARPVAELGSIMIVVATDAPLLPHQLNRVARRAAMGLARTGSTAGNGSGDLIVAFSTAPVGSPHDIGREILPVAMLQNEWMSPLFDATVEATEEAILNALFAADAMTGRDGTRIDALPLDKVRSVLAQHRAIEA
ncbi:DmpA family aminopeptidase [Sphingomonas qomolangmaensis]|uniref:P1 family peptidase n=1 Tax=Sphingomonas qomolangmaensis TaxID=2918765 RepID=A0ABY5L5U0_9SPHN|nr:P1 family peptidase [Sphingomonas qomolangmaensis]UUL82318.1 P1 family peptidase [Sphingomonas qomolangmaensis]